MALAMKPKRLNVVKSLNKHLGPGWKYDGISCWVNPDGRHVARTSSGVDEYDNLLGPPDYWLYEGDKEPRKVIFLGPDIYIRG